MAEKHQIYFSFDDQTDLQKNDTIKIEKVQDAEGKTIGEPSELAKSILNLLNGGTNNKSIERLAFEADPSQVNQYQSLYKMKQRLIPDAILKRIMVQDDLVACILQARQSQIAAFGMPRPDRFSTGYIIEPNTGVLEKLSPEEREELDDRIKRAIKKFASCGATEGWDYTERCPFAQWLAVSVRDGLGVGRLATEFVYRKDLNGKKQFHSFRYIDAGTIYRAANHQEAAESLRENARLLLEGIKNEKIDPEQLLDDKYAYIQVIDGRPVQAFKSDECSVYNFYPVSDVALDGYPVTPIDTAIAAITTHINITNHNKMYFQNGRAAKGMLVLQSDDVDEKVIQRIRQQFNASINNVNNSWRMPVFGVNVGETIQWQSIDSTSRDMEFQYLTDMNARVILSVFQIAPEELPGWSYLSRGTNNQSLAESNNEFRLQAARDLGMRPIIAKLEDFLNTVIFPLIDSSLAQICRIRLMGLDAESPEKESVNLTQTSGIHMTMNQVLEKVEKKPIPAAMGGDFPLNQAYAAVIDKYLSVGEIKEYFFGIKGASKDPSLAYYRDPFWMQYYQMQMQAQMQQQQSQQSAAQGASASAGEAEGPQDPQPQSPKGGGNGGNSPEDNNSEAATDLTRSVNQAIDILTKSEQQLPVSKRKLLHQQKKTVEYIMQGFEKDLEDAMQDILQIADKGMPAKARG